MALCLNESVLLLEKDYILLEKQIRVLDPDGKFVKVDLESQEVWYNPEIKQHRKIRQLTPEEMVRAFLVSKLVSSLGYKPQCIELEKEKIIGRKGNKEGVRIDVLVREDKEKYKPFMIIEAKAPDEYEKQMEDSLKFQLFEVAKLEKGVQYLVYYTAYPDKSKNEVKERILSVSFSKHESYNDWEDSGTPNLLSIPRNYGKVEKPVFTKGGLTDLRKDVEKNELDRIRRELHNVLWGGGRYQGNEIFLFVMKMLLSKIYDEKETEDSKPYGFQIFQVSEVQQNRQLLKDEPTKDSVARLNELYRQALQSYLKVDRKDARSRDIKKIGEKTIDDRKIKFVIEKFQDISLTENDYDLLGDFFETFLWDEFKQSKGQFFTHQNIVDFIIHALDLENLSVSKINEEREMPYILDPSCGSGTFLIQAMKNVTTLVNRAREENAFRSSQSVRETLASNFPEHKKYAWAGNYIFGLDFNEDLALATKVNMIMHGDGSANIEASDGLSDFSRFVHPKFKKKKRAQSYDKPVNEEFDVIITNPPFSIDLDKETKKELPQNFTKAGTGSSENLFIERWYQLLKPYGRVGAVLPESVLDTKENKAFRIFIYKHFWIRAVVSLPYLAFQPFTSTKTSILFLQKKPEEEVKRFDEKWKHYEEEYEGLETRFKRMLKESGQSRLDQEGYQRASEFRNILSELLISGMEPGEENSTLKHLKAKYSDILSNSNPFRIEKEWWVFSRVSSDLDYSIFMASAEEVGYKRLRSVKKRPNDLYAQSTQGGQASITIDTENPITILDHLRREVDWTTPPS